MNGPFPLFLITSITISFSSKDYLFFMSDSTTNNSSLITSGISSVFKILRICDIYFNHDNDNKKTLQTIRKIHRIDLRNGII